MLKSASQNESRAYRVIVLNGTATAVLVTTEKGFFALPDISIPVQRRVAETLTAAVRIEWGVEVICLFTFSHAVRVGEVDDVIYEVVEYWRDSQKNPASTQWVEIPALSPGDFQDKCDYVAITRVKEQCSTSGCGPFARLGWFADFCNWLEQIVRNRGFHLSGEFRQLSASPFFSLVRCETTGPAVWFKAVGEPNSHEFPVTLKIAERFAGFVPAVLAVRPEWRGWVSEEAQGTNLTEVNEVAPWQLTASTLAELQITSINEGAPLLAVGARDLRIAALSEFLHPFLKAMRHLMSLQKKSPPTILEDCDLTLIETQLHDALQRLKAFAIPDSLGHLDINPGNVVVRTNQCQFLDWAEAYVGLPFLTFEYLLEHYRSSAGYAPVLESSMSDLYYKHWEKLLSIDVLAEIKAIAPLIAVFAYAVVCEGWVHFRPDTSENAGYFRSLTRRMWREAIRLDGRTVSCQPGKEAMC
jgi:hypothetical protein